MDPAIQGTSVLQDVLATSWFYYLDLIGTLAFALAGVLKAYRLDYDYFGTFLLATLPAVGGGTLRDLLVGGDRHPPFIFHDPTYMYIVIAVTLAAIVWSRYFRSDRRITGPFAVVLNISDTVGVAAFTAIGAKVAIEAQLDWFWAPFLAAITCAGGGLISNAVTGDKQEGLMGEPYEEIAVAGGLFLVFGLEAAAQTADPVAWCYFVVFAQLVGTFLARGIVIRHGMRTPTLRPEGPVRSPVSMMMDITQFRRFVDKD